jgi:hypothetical protein
MSPSEVGKGLASGWTYAPDARDICPVMAGLGIVTRTTSRLVPQAGNTGSIRSGRMVLYQAKDGLLIQSLANYNFIGDLVHPILEGRDLESRKRRQQLGGQQTLSTREIRQRDVCPHCLFSRLRAGKSSQATHPSCQSGPCVVGSGSRIIDDRVKS